MGGFDILVVGCGITGAVISRRLADVGYKVQIIDRRDHIGGNMYDYIDKYGILVHKYGPHTFHTKKKELFDFMTKYSDWQEYHLRCGAEINGICTPTPFNFKTIDDFYSLEEAKELKQRIKKAFPKRKTATVLEVLSCKDEMVRRYAKFLFDNDYALYTAKQWGISASEIDPSVLKRVPLRFNYDDRYFDDPYQVIPKDSYTLFFKNLLDCPNISIQLSVDALDVISIENSAVLYEKRPCAFPVVYTGAIDELFGYEYGALPYRSLEFRWKHEDVESKQNMAVVAYPQEVGFTRIVEFKKMTPDRMADGTTYEIEYSLPYKRGVKWEPYYPVLTEESQARYAKYRAHADRISNLYCCGRLGDFKYYNMDEALEAAIDTAAKLIKVISCSDE